MGTCKYILKGRTFDSELALEEYLMNNEHFSSLVGDEVFALTTEQKAQADALLNNERQDAIRSILRGQEYLMDIDTDAFPDYISKVMPAGHYAVTSALKQYRKADGTRLFPEFGGDNYWQHKFKDWESIDYWTKGIKTNDKFGAKLNMASDDEIKIVFGEGTKRSDILNPPTKDQMTRGREIFEKVWPLQGFIGSGIHRMFRFYWDYVRASDGHVDDATLLTKFDEALDFDLVKGNVIPEFEKFKGIKLSEIIPESLKRKMIDHCNTIREALKTKFGEDMVAIPEISIMTSIPDFNNPSITTNLVGNLDLVVIDKEGGVHVVDYKTSPKDYNNYNSAKIRTFYYQLATYRRILERMGVNVRSDSNAYVIPVKFTNFEVHPEETDLRKIVTFSGISLQGKNASSVIETLNLSANNELSDSISDNLKEFIPIADVPVVEEKDLLDNTRKFIERMFPMFGKSNECSKEWVKNKLEKAGAFKKKNNVFSYEMYIHGKKNTITAPSEEELIAKVYKEYSKSDERLQERTRGIKDLIRSTKKNGGKVEEPLKKGKYSEGRHADWLDFLIERYGNENYNLLDNYSDALEKLGIILVQNVHTGKIDVLACDTSIRDFTETIYLGGDTPGSKKRTTLTGTFVSDTVAKNKQNELVLQSNYGNIRLMEIMAAVNQMTNLFSSTGTKQKVLGEITLFNPYKNSGFSAPNEQLVYNFTELCREAEKADKQKYDNHFNSKQIKVASYLDLARHKANEIFQNSKAYGYWKAIKGSELLNDSTTNPTILKAELLKVAQDVEESFGISRNTKGDNLFDAQKAEAYRFVQNCYSAIAELDGVKFRQQTTDHDDILNQKGLKDAVLHGWSGNMLDNPGMLDSETLNLIGKQVNIAYQNTRDEMQVIAKKLFALSEKLKNENGFGYLKSRTFGNETKLYKNMYDESYENDLVFKNPFDSNERTLTETEREYLKTALLLINKNRHGIKDEAELREAIKVDPHNYLKVPLTVGTTQSKVAYQGMFGHMKEAFSKWLPTKANIREFFRGVLTDDLAENDERNLRWKDSEHWQMTNDFDAGDYDKARASMLKKYSSDYFEHNLELLTMKHCYAYTLKNNMDNAFPIIKACALQLGTQGAIMNTEFTKDIEYLHKFIKSKILNMSIEHDNIQWLSYISGKAMSAASKLILAFNPLQLYQAIDGMWKDISLVIRKPDGTQAFTSKNMRDGFMWAYSDLTHNWGDKKSLGQILNEQYGINDMDMNTYVEKIKPNQFGFWNMNNIMFHFASRPDFYNRMTIFGAHMKADGCFDAHDAEGNYDWTKDKRYELFAKYHKDESSIPSNLKEEYFKQKARYKAVAQAFESEGAKYKDKDGNLVAFTLDLKEPKPLPRAYTIQEAESIKSICDLTYGYYSHEKRSLMQATTLGALFMQMNTYWSSKKNQWLAPGAIRMQGEMVHYSEKQPDGSEKYYYIKYDENGNPEYTDEVTDTPFMVWRGQYQEGIFVTAANVLHDAFFGDAEGTKGIKNAVDKYWNNEDENMRRAYRNNLNQLWYDLLMMILLGMIFAPALENAAQKHAKEVGNGDLGLALINNANANLTKMFVSSTRDFNPFESIFGRATQWTPFALSTLTKELDLASSLISGNKDWYDTVIKFSNATRSQENLFDYVKINALGRKIGDNGKPQEN